MKNAEKLHQYQAYWDNLLQTQQEDLQDALTSTTREKAAAFLMSIPIAEAIDLLVQIPVPQRGQIVTALPHRSQYMLSKKLDNKAFASIFNHMSVPARNYYYQRLSYDEQLKLLPYLHKTVRETILALSIYPPRTAGNLMGTDFATVFENMTVAQAIQKLKEDAPSSTMVYYLYVVDAEMHMKGVVSLKDLILADGDERLEQYINTKFISANIEEDQETLAECIEENELIALPIINKDNQLVGIVNYERAIDIIRIEQKEDMEQFAGIVSNLSEDVMKYLTISSWQHFRKRWAWILGLFAAGIISTLLLQQYETILERITILTFYLPMITGTGGNIGSQTASVIIRALSFEQISLKNWIKIVINETKIALLLAIMLCIIAFIEVVLITNNHVLPYSITRIATAITLSLGIHIVVASIMGASLPLIAKHFNGDPAVIASPAITSLVDITGMIIYFYIATTMLG